MDIETYDQPDGLAYHYRVRMVDDSDLDSPRQDRDNLARPFLLDDRGNGRRIAVKGDEDQPDEYGNVLDAIEHGGFDLAARYLSVVCDAVAVQFSFRDYDSDSLWYMPRSVGRAELRTPGESETLDDVIRAAIEVEIAYYEAWAGGEGFGYEVERAPLDTDEWELIESCFGYFGAGHELDWSYALEDAVAVTDLRRKEDDAAETRRLAEIAADNEEISCMARAEAGL